MKDFLKISSVALALVALASCSNDDLLTSQSIHGVNGKNTLDVTVEPLKENGLSTRAMSAGNAVSITWTESDKIKVYDSQLHIWDGYQFDGTSAFTLFTDQDLETAMYALYPFGQGAKGAGIDDDLTNGGVISTNWSKGGSTTATMQIPATLVYDENTEDNTYWCSLPMWGTVESTEGKLKTHLEWMTTILRIKLAHVLGNADFIEIRAFQDQSETKKMKVAGDFTAELFPDDPTKTQLESVITTTAKEQVLTINLKNAKQVHSVIYAPIPVMKDAIVKLYLKKGATVAAAEYVDIEGNKLDGAVPYKVLSQKDYIRGGVYGVAEEDFGTSGATVEQLNTALDNKDFTEAKGTVTLKAEQVTAVTKTDNVLRIPNIDAENLVLDLQGFTGEALTIQYKSSSDPYTGLLTLKVAHSTSNNIEVNLPKTAVQMVGTYTGTTKSIYASEIIVGDGVDTEDENYVATSLSYSTIGGEAKNITVLENAVYSADLTLQKLNKVESIVVEGTVTGNIDAATEAPDPSNAAGATVAVKGNGEVTGAITALNNVTISGEASVKNAAITSKKGDINVTDKASVRDLLADEGTVTVGVTSGSSEVTLYGGIIAEGRVRVFTTATVRANTGTVTSNAADVFLKGVDLSKTSGTVSAATGVNILEGAKAHNVKVADGGTVMMGQTSKLSTDGVKGIEEVTGTLTLGKGATLKLNQGYVKELATPNTTEEEEKATVEFSATPSYAAIYTTDYGFIQKNDSKWNGKPLPNDVATVYVGANIWTANQLAHFKGETACNLNVNVDLGTYPWTALEVGTGVTFAGNNKTIKGGKVTGDNGNFGLFSTLAGTVENLTIDGLSVTATAGSGKTVKVGAVAGQANGGSISNVEVKNVTLASNQVGVGGLVGEVAGDVTITGKTGANTFSTVTASITGANQLGGIVGVVTGGTMSISNYKAVPTFELSATPTGTVNYACGTVAPFVGTAFDGATVTVTDDAGYKGTADLNKTGLYFEKNFVMEGSKIYKFQGSKAVGYCPKASNAEPIKSDDTSTSTAEVNAKKGFVYGEKADDVKNSSAVNVYIKE